MITNRMSKKVFILVSDGVSIRNFVYSSFCDIASQNGIELVFWNSTAHNLQALNVNEIRIENARVSTISDLLKTALIRIELNRFAKRDNDLIYHTYKFSLSRKTLKLAIRSLMVRSIAFFFNSENGINIIRSKIRDFERKTDYYQQCEKILKAQKPDFIFSASQRDIISIAPIVAAEDLGIPTATFIYSWDNVPKATTMVDAKYYFVWSEHMKKELLHYQKYIKPKQIFVTGTPQFDNHSDKSLRVSKEVFFETHNLDVNKKYICFSGDDITTSPNDPLYLRDLSIAINKLNNKGYNIGIIFRRCPVDFSNRFDEVLQNYNRVIVPIEPIWNKTGNIWNTIFPTSDDYKLQTNIIKHTECVVNLGSSMVFDYAAYKKPCAFMNYNYFENQEVPQKGVHVYDFVHFRSKPSHNVVCWLNHPNEISEKIEALLEDSTSIVDCANEWYEKINQHPPELASLRICDSIATIIKKEPYCKT